MQIMSLKRDLYLELHRTLTTQRQQKHQGTQFKHGQQESRMVVARSWGEGQKMGNYCLVGTEFQIYKMKKFRRSVSQ